MNEQLHAHDILGALFKEILMKLNYFFQIDVNFDGKKVS